MEKILGKIVVESVTDNPDGTSTIVFNIPDDVKENIKQSLSWKRWSDKKFNQLVIESLESMYGTHRKELADGEPTRQINSNLIDPFDSNVGDTSKNND